MDLNKKVPIPPTRQLYLPLPFWLDVISYLDKKAELALTGSGHGIITMTIKMHKGKIHEIMFGEELRVRDVIEKVGPKGVSEKQKSVT